MWSLTFKSQGRAGSERRRRAVVVTGALSVSPLSLAAVVSHGAYLARVGLLPDLFGEGRGGKESRALTTNLGDHASQSRPKRVS